MKTTLDDEEVLRQYPDTSSDDCFEALYNRYVAEVHSRYLPTIKDTGKTQDFTHE